jgi:DNA repair protein RecN (Recombination protein N)
MLQRLSINNIVLIDKAEIDLANGFTVLTGETGAGKSILLDAISLLLGARVNTGIIRHGEAQASAYAEFDVTGSKEIADFLHENAFEVSDNLTLKRIIFADGRSKAFINDSAASAGNLKEIGSYLIEIHGQSEQSNLLQAKYHQSIIDEYAKLTGQVSGLSKIFDELKNAKNKLQFLLSEKERLAKDQEYFEYVLKELNQLNISENEEVELAEKRQFLMNSGKLYDVLQSALKQISGDDDIVRNLLNTQKILGRNGNLIPEKMREDINKITDDIEKAIELNSNISNNLEAVIDGFDTGNTTLDKVEERLFKIREICRKYQKQSSELEAFANEIAGKLNLITGNDTEIKTLEAQTKKLRAQYLELAQEISGKRIKAAEKLEKNIIAELKPLKMEGCKFKVEITPRDENSWNENGIDDVKFKVATNAGQAFSDIAKVASGGELSRLMLALKVVISGVKSVPTIIFDEIDTGIGGSVADSVGERLEKLGQNLQVLVVTHQPQVAAKGHNHFKISKKLVGKTYQTSIQTLDEKARNEEIARMLSGAEITDEARLAAKKLRA